MLTTCCMLSHVHATCVVTCLPHVHADKLLMSTTFLAKFGLLLVFIRQTAIQTFILKRQIYFEYQTVLFRK